MLRGGGIDAADAEECDAGVTTSVSGRLHPSDDSPDD
jgi:hypothetical protein